MNEAGSSEIIGKYIPYSSHENNKAVKSYGVRDYGNLFLRFLWTKKMSR
jgi:hypothetical protein